MHRSYLLCINAYLYVLYTAVYLQFYCLLLTPYTLLTLYTYYYDTTVTITQKKSSTSRRRARKRMKRESSKECVVYVFIEFVLRVVYVFLYSVMCRRKGTITPDHIILSYTSHLALLHITLPFSGSLPRGCCRAIDGCAKRTVTSQSS